MSIASQSTIEVIPSGKLETYPLYAVCKMNADGETSNAIVGIPFEHAEHHAIILANRFGNKNTGEPLRINNNQLVNSQPAQRKHVAICFSFPIANA